jgi:FtsP/CotA-like multicopper oxidase with cupredoxin domain/peroxiredoxin
VQLQRTVDAARGSSNGFHEPEEWAFPGLSVLNVGPARVTVPGAAQDGSGGPQDFEVLTYNGRPYGPTIRVRRGTTFRIRVHNHLHGPPGKDNPDRPNGLCTTNLHTHGLHVSPADPADNVYRCIEPGESHTFVYTLPANHPSGSYWYHPHKHGSVGYQVSNGLAGVLIVEGSDEDGITDLEDIPEIAAARDLVFLFQQYNYVVGTDGIARIDATAIYNPVDNPDYPRSCDDIDLHAAPGTPSADPLITINGVVMPEIRMAPGEVQRWRFVHAGIEQEQHMVWTDAMGNELKQSAPDPTAPQFFEIAKDGLATGDMKVRPTIDLYPGYRSDLLVQAPPLPAGTTEAVYFIKKAMPPEALQLRPGAQASATMYLAKLVVRGRHRAMKLPDPAALKPCRPYPPVANGDLSPTTIGTNGLITFRSDDATLRYEVNGQEFHEQTPARLMLRTAQEWKLKALANSHPFHIHVNSFQVTGHLDGNGNPVADGVGDWKDTLFIPEGHTYTIRHRFQDFAGQTVFHCHILDHEDQGMMMPLELHDGTIPLPPQAVCHEARAPGKLSPAATPAPGLRLAEEGGAVWDLTGARGGVVILVFFQGVDCPHCVGQLRNLVREARGAPGAGVTVMAVSGRPVADRARALATLGVREADRFGLFVDADHRAFREFACYDGGPLHGLFVIDGGGVIRARYVGEAPFDNPRQAVLRARSLERPAPAAASR